MDPAKGTQYHRHVVSFILNNFRSGQSPNSVPDCREVDLKSPCGRLYTLVMKASGVPAIAAAIVTFATSMLGGCGGHSRPAAHVVERARPAMGSELRLTAWTADEAAALAAFDAVFAEFERLDALMSVWRPGSDVLRLNAAAGDRPVALQPDVIEVLTIARQVSEWTDGTVRRDVRRAVGPVEIRSRSGQHDSRSGHRPRSVFRSPIIAGSRSTRAPGPRFSDAKACGCTWAGSARATRWIARSRCFDREACRTS